MIRTPWFIPIAPFLDVTGCSQVLLDGAPSSGPQMLAVRGLFEAGRLCH